MAPTKSGDKGKGGVQALNGFKRRAGIRNRSLECRSKRNLAPKCPSKDGRRNESAPLPPLATKDPRPPPSSISVGSPVSLKDFASSVETDRERN